MNSTTESGVRGKCPTCGGETTLTIKTDFFGVNEYNDRSADGSVPFHCEKCAGIPDQMEDNFNEWECPRCGWNIENDDEKVHMVACSPPRYAAHIAIQYGGDPADWTETWKCPRCSQVFDVETGNY